MNARRGARELFDELVDADVARRRRRLEEIAVTEPALAAEVGRLLAADARSEGPLERLRADLAAAAEAGVLGGAAAEGAPPRLGAWRLETLLGRGGMGEVWLAERTEGFAQRAAIKIVRAGLAGAGLFERFLLERQVLARLEHPSIARVYDGGVAPDGRPWYAMELVQGAAITTFAAERRLPMRARLELLIAAAEAVDWAHRSLVVHRDLKPSNILVTGDGRPKLVDFGLAKLLEPELDPQLTRTEMRALTPAYAAPEQVLGEPVTTATDVYALGVILYELLTGELPHRRSSPTAAGLADEISRETIERPSSRLRRAVASAERSSPVAVSPRELEGDIDTIALRALAREPGRRYPSAAAFADDLRRYLDGRPVAARPDGAGYQLAKFVGRHRLGVAAAAAVLVSLVAGLGAALLQADRARREASRAVRVRDLLVSIFEQSTPEVSGNADVRASALLDGGSRRIEEELASSEPEVASELLSTISGAFFQLGRFEDAERLGRRAVELLGSVPETEATAIARERAMRAYGEALAEQRRLDEAVAVLEESYRRSRARLGPEALHTAYAERAFAQALNHVGRHEEALEHDLHVLEVYRRLLPAEHRELAIHYISLGSSYDWLDRTEESIAAYRRGIEMLERLLGPSHTQLADPLNNLAVVYALADRFDEALPPIERAVAIRRASVPWGHPWLAFTLSQYSGILSGLDRLDESTRVATEMLEMLRASDPDDPNVPRALNRLAVDELRRGRPEIAAERFSEVFAAAERIGIAADDPRRLSWLSNSSQADLELNRLGTARSRLEESLAGRRAQGGEERAEFASALSPWGTLLRLEGDFDGALAAHRRAIELVESNRGAGHAQADAARLELAEDLLARGEAGDFDAALAAAREVRERWAAIGPEDRLRVLDAELVLARAALVAGKVAEASDRFAVLVERQRKRRGEESLPTLETEIYLAAARGESTAPRLAAYAARRGRSHWAVARVEREVAAAGARSEGEP